MTGSEWESIQKSFRKRIVLLLCFILPLSLIGGIFFYNNRDFFNNNDNDSVPEQLNELTHTISERTDSLSIDTVVNVLIDSADKPQGMLPETGSSEEDEVTLTQSSIILPEFECRTFDRNDVRLLMSVELFFSGEITDKEVALMRNDLKVIIRQLVRNRELVLVKKEILKSEIIRSANDRLGVDVFTDLKFIDFKIEKAVTQ